MKEGQGASVGIRAGLDLQTPAYLPYVLGILDSGMIRAVSEANVETILPD